MTPGPNIRRLVIIVFFGLGMLCLLIAGWSFKSTYSFVSSAVFAKGTLVGYEDRFTRDRDGATHHMYAPRFRFVTRDGQDVEVVSRQSFSWRNDVGSPVAVLYPPGDPQSAELDSWWQWMISAIFGLGGSCALVVGIVLFGRMQRASRRRSELLMHGTPIQARVVGVELNTSITYNGRSPWRVLCQWQDPADARMYVFASDDIWFDPTEYIPQGAIRVLIDPANPASYYVDLSFLPMLADA
jgi:Protein of unknown function (DUF3592)